MIEFQYFKNCPNAAETLANLRFVVKQFGIDENELKLTEVNSPEDADLLNFLGSPTILIDGVDMTTGKMPTGFSFNCRIYRYDGRTTGILSVEYIRSSIKVLAKLQRP